MTLEEHVDNICNWKHNAGLRGAVLDQMRELLEECATIAKVFGEDNADMGDVRWAATRIEERIRALATRE